MQHGGTLDNFTFRGPLYIHKKSPREQIPQNNHKRVSLPKDYNKNKDTSNNIGPPQDTISRTCPKVNLERFEYPYYHINPMDNTHEDNHLIGTQEQYIEDADVEKEKLFEETNDKLITE